MLNSLDALVITFFAMSFISILGVILMFFIKNEKWKKRTFYGLSIWGVVVAFCNMQTYFSYMIGDIVVAVLLGFLAVAAVLIQKFSKKAYCLKAAQAMTVASVVAGIIHTFLI